MVPWQLKALAIAPKVSGFLSLICSTLIVFNILSLPSIKRQQIYTRLILALSIFDIIASLFTALSTWPIPKESPSLYASGNNVTCSIQGFMLQLSGLSTVLHNTSLAVYYWAVLVLKWNDRKIRNELAIWLHGVPVVLPLISAFVGLFMKLYNNAGLWCWAATVPSVCGGDTGVKCERGEHAGLFRWVAFYGPIWICIIFVTILMIFVFFDVRKTEKASVIYRAQNKGSQTSFHSNGDASSTMMDTDRRGEEVEEDQDHDTISGNSIHSNSSTGNESKTSKLSKAKSVLSSAFKNRKNTAVKNRKRAMYQDMQLKLTLTRKVFWQSLFYVLAFYVCWVFPTILRLKQALKQPVPAYIVLGTAMILPLQGFFNAFVYFRPRLEHWRKSRVEAARKRKQAANERISSVTMGSIVAGNSNQNEIDVDNNDDNNISDDQVGSLEMESNPAYALSLATAGGIPERRLVGYNQHQESFYKTNTKTAKTRPRRVKSKYNDSNRINKIGDVEIDGSDSWSASLNDVENDDEEYRMAPLSENEPITEKDTNSFSSKSTFADPNVGEPQSFHSKLKGNDARNLVKELQDSTVIRIKGTKEIIQDTSVVYNQLFESDEQPTFDAIYQLPPPSSSSSDKPKRGLFMLYGDLCHIYKASMKSSSIWKETKNIECRTRIEYELEGLTSILIVDLRNHTENGQQQWEEFIEPLVLTGDVKVIEITN